MTVVFEIDVCIVSELKQICPSSHFVMAGLIRDTGRVVG